MFRTFAQIFKASVLVAASAAPARAHIQLTSPAEWLDDGGGILANAQKHQPCGDIRLGTATGKITEVHAGDMLTVSWKEVIPHTGWFRLALAPDRAMLKEPIATVDSASGDAKDATTTKPEGMLVNVDGVYIIDGLFHHEGGERKSYSTMFPVPNISCTHCTLQLIQFMVDHGSNTGGNDGFFYHRCADLSIAGSVDAGPPGDPGVDGGGGSPADAGATADAAATGAGGAPGTDGGVAAGGAPGTDGGVAAGSDDGGCAIGGRGS